MTPESRKPPITPNMKVGDFLNHYPELENTLMNMSPAFAKLKNPILRKTIARVSTLGQAAAVGNVKIADLINELRKAAGINEAVQNVDIDTIGNSKPSWLEKQEIAETFDARPMIEMGEQPLTIVFQKLMRLECGKILRLVTPFYPAPIIDKARSMGFEAWSDKIEDNLTRSYFFRNK